MISLHFKEYDSCQPLIYIHVPKVAGTSIRKLLKKRLRNRLVNHYKMPPKFDPPLICENLVDWDGEPKLIFGHFSRSSGLAVEHSYPQVRQYISMLRDPLELSVSFYRYTRRRADYRFGKTLLQKAKTILRGGLSLKAKLELERLKSEVAQYGSLEQYLQVCSSPIFDHFPVRFPEESLSEYLAKNFVYIGIVEDLAYSLKMIENLLGGEFGEPNHLNCDREKLDFREALSSEVVEIFKQRNKREIELYQFVKSNYKLEF